MQGCFSWLLLLAGGVFVMMTLLRWFDQVAEAVDNGWWNKLLLLICMPFAVWLFPGGRVGAGRPTPVAPHQPTRGFGTVPKPRPANSPPTPPPPDLPVANLPPPPPHAPTPRPPPAPRRLPVHPP